MAFNIKLTITGIQRAQDMNNWALAALQPQGALGRAVQHGTTSAHRYAVQVTHVDTGSLRAAHRQHVDLGRLRGVVDIDPAAVNPRTHQKPHKYGFYEHERGGTHAFYERTEREAGSRILSQMANIVKRGFP